MRYQTHRVWVFKQIKSSFIHALVVYLSPVLNKIQDPFYFLILTSFPRPYIEVYKEIQGTFVLTVQSSCKNSVCELHSLCHDWRACMIGLVECFIHVLVLYTLFAY